MPTPQHSSLPQRTSVILYTLERFQQATTSQLRRLHYSVGGDGGRLTDRSSKVLASRNLKRLTELGKLRRVLGVHDNRPPEYVYMLPGTTAKPYDHTLDIAELYISLAEVIQNQNYLTFAPEGWYENKIGMLTVTADAYVEITGIPGKTESRRRYIELDRSSERPNVIKKKLRHYHNIWSEEWDRDRHGGVWPTVVWVVHTRARQAEIKRCIASMPEPALFICWTFDEAPAKLTAGI